MSQFTERDWRTVVISDVAREATSTKGMPWTSACCSFSQAPSTILYDYSCIRSRGRTRHQHLKTWRILSEEGGRYRAPLEKYERLLKAVTGLFFSAAYE